MNEDYNKKGIAAGASMAGIGAGALGLAHGDKFIKPEKMINARRNLIKRTGSAKAAKELLSNTNKIGKASLAIGTTIAGVSAYKHFKNKKKNDNTEK